MKKALFYYSVTGNCKKLAQTIKNNNPEYEIIDIKDGFKGDLNNYSVVGFLSPIYYLNINPIFKDFLNGVDPVENKKAFFIVAYSVMWGRAIKNIGNILSSKGFDIVGYEKILTSETFPPYRKKGILNDNYPEQNEIDKLNSFLKNIEDRPTCNVKLGFWDIIISPPKDKKIKKDFGELKINHSICTKCMECVNRCEFNALEFIHEVVVSKNKCKWCYACYNNCKEKAISTTKISSQYSIN